MGTKTKSYRAIQKFNRSVNHNFEVSLVMSFYHRLEEFKRVLPRNAPYLQRNGIEVVIAMDEPTEQEGLIELIKTYPLINWKVIVNEQKHTPRNHAPVLNVGIRHATKKYILLCDPETEFYTDVILQLRELLENYPGHYATGTMAFVEYTSHVTPDKLHQFDWMQYGSLMVEKTAMEEIGAIDEQFKVWGGEDDNIRRRLHMAGIKQLKVPGVKSLHREEKLMMKERFAKTNSFSAKELKTFFYPKHTKVNGNGWGREFNKVAYDWQNNLYAEELCRKYLEGFMEHEIKDSGVFHKKYKKLLLCQAYNETEFMPGFLEDMAKYFDGIILLDDESTDDTWELAQHDKILLKAKKKRDGFNDLKNRNILLNLASFFKAEWFCFMDIDERFDERFVDFETFEDDPEVDVVAFRAVYLWNDENTYNEGTPYSKKGILKIFRMFRPIGHTCISTYKNKLHFIVCPYISNTLIAKILFKDYGSMKESHRIKKYKMYKHEDKNMDLATYEYLLDNKSTLYELDKIELK